jgi:hypothetical protein
MKKRKREKSRSSAKLNIKIPLNETGCKTVCRIYINQYKGQWWADMNAVINLWIP